MAQDTPNTSGHAEYATVSPKHQEKSSTSHKKSEHTTNDGHTLPKKKSLAVFPKILQSQTLRKQTRQRQEGKWFKIQKEYSFTKSI